MVSVSSGVFELIRAILPDKRLHVVIDYSVGSIDPLDAHPILPHTGRPTSRFLATLPDYPFQQGSSLSAASIKVHSFQAMPGQCQGLLGAVAYL
jgi:hypothetical protein